MPTLPIFATQLSAPPRGLRRPNTKRSAAVSWPAHLITLAVLLLVYLAGHSTGRDAALSPAATQLGSAASHPACHPNLKP